MSTGMFYLSNSNDQGFADVAFAYGWSNRKPITGDWNSDGIDSIGLFNISDGHFYLRNANTAGNADLVFAFGDTTDLPLAGNWDGVPSMLPPTPTPSPTPVTPPAMNASFTYDGDGKRVKSTINGTTTYFVGAHYEVANGVVTKYYYAGAQRIAMRTNGTLKFLLGDHLGSTSLTTDAGGNVVSEMRYKAWGEVRYASGNMPTQYQYTGQFSNMSDFGLMFYNARWYDPYLNHFTQPDSIVPNPSNPQSYDRYAYVNNNPVRYTDPTGHKCVPEDECQRPLKPHWVDRRKLTSKGIIAYDTYIKLFNDPTGWWWTDPNLGGDGFFSVKDFVALNFYEEVADYYNSPNFSAWNEGLVRSFYSWKQAMPSEYTSGNEGLLNFTYAQAGATTRTGPANFDDDYDESVGIPLMQSLVEAIKDPAGTGHRDWARGCIKDAPCRVGSYSPGGPNLSYIGEFLSEGCQPSYLVDSGCSSYIGFLFILDAEDSAYWDERR
jgi:RHS repeat-associated protein